MIATVEQFQGVFEKALIQEIHEFGTEMHFKEGDVIMEYGKFIKMMPLILSGTIKVMRKDDHTEQEVLLYFLSASESCSMAYSCCMEQKRSEIRAIAEDDVTIIGLPQQKLNEWICKYPSWRQYIMRSFNERFNELLRTVESIAFLKLDDRLIAYLLEKHKLYGSAVIKGTHATIADDLTTSRVVISRLLKKLENARKLIIYRNEIKLLPSFFNQ